MSAAITNPILMKRTVIALLLLVSCETNQPTERYGFVARLGRDTVSVKSVTRRGKMTLVSDEVAVRCGVTESATSAPTGVPDCSA